MAPVLRPLRDEDVEACELVRLRAFGIDPEGVDLSSGLVRTRHVLEHDPGGAWVSVDADDRPTGMALAVVRDRLWALGLLVVSPEAQSGGAGRALLARALGHGADRCKGWITAASEDPRAVRAYARAGLSVVPTMSAFGRPRGMEVPDGVRPGATSDRAHIDRVDREIRGAAHGLDVLLVASLPGTTFWVSDDGYAVALAPFLACVIARHEQGAQGLLRAVLASWPADVDCEVAWLSAAQGWALPVLFEAGMELRPAGPLMMRGTMGPMTPYLPTGAWL